MSCNAGRFVLQSLCKQCDLWLNVDRESTTVLIGSMSILRESLKILRGSLVRQCRGCVRSQQLWIGSWQQEAAGPDPGFNILPAVPCAGCQLAGPRLAQVDSTGFSWRSGRFSAHFLLTLQPSFSQGHGPFRLLKCCCGASFEESFSLRCCRSGFIYGWWLLFKSTTAWKNLGIPLPLFHKWGVHSLPDTGCPVFALQSPIIPVKKNPEKPLHVDTVGLCVTGLF